MKCLIIGGNRFVGLRLSLMLESVVGLELHILNRTGQAPHCKTAIIHKGDRRHLATSHLDRDWDLVYDFAAFNQAEAEDALGFFGKIGRYIFISSASIYDHGTDLKEEAFNPQTWDLNSAAKGDYQDGKRRAEAVFAQRASFPVLSVRFPVILGPDDYTGRLEFHRDRVTKGEPIFIPKLGARVSMVHAEDAADFLFWARDKALAGPLNVAGRDPISMGDLLSRIEFSTGKRPVLAREATPENQSPYAPDGDWFMNMDRLAGLGFRPRPIEAWLPDLLGKPEPSERTGYVH